MVLLWFPYGFPMASLWFAYGFQIVFLWFSYGFPMVFLWLPDGCPMFVFSHDFRMVIQWSPMVFLYGLPILFPHDNCHIDFLWVSYGFPMGFLCMFYGFPMVSYGFLMVSLWFLDGHPLVFLWSSYDFRLVQSRKTTIQMNFYHQQVDERNR